MAFKTYRLADCRVNTVSHDGRETAYRQTDFGEQGTASPDTGDTESAEKSPILYVHGAGGSHRVWVEQYGPEGVGPAVAVDLTGHGASADVDLQPGRETLDAYADDVVAVAERTGARTLVGHSMGGAVAQWIALERDLPLDALVLCDTGAKLGVDDQLIELLDGDFPAAVESLHGPDLLFHDADEQVLEQSMTMLTETGATVTSRDFRTCDGFDVRDRLGEIDVPVLALAGEHDGMTPPSFTEYLCDTLPDCETELLGDAAHMSMLEVPEKWNDRLQAFVSRLA